MFTRKRYKVAAALLAVVVLLSSFLPRAFYGEKVQVETVVQRNFTQIVVASGHVENPYRIDIGVQQTGSRVM